MSDSTDENICKIFGSEFWHDSVEIIGSPQALKELRNAIDCALENGSGRADAFESDGEGYEIRVVKHEVSWEDWCKLPNHYTDREFTGGSDSEKWDRLYELLKERFNRKKSGEPNE